MSIELRKLHLENRLAKLSIKPVENKRLINKVKRELRTLD